MTLKAKKKKKIGRHITISALFWLVQFEANAFECITSDGSHIPVYGGVANVHVNLNPSVGIGQNLIIDFSSQIFCRNNFPNTFTDYVSVGPGTGFSGGLTHFSGNIQYAGASYPIPFGGASSSEIIYNSTTYSPWPAVLFLTPLGSAGGVAISAGQQFATINLRQTNQIEKPKGKYYIYEWRIFANNAVTIPTGGCDVNIRNVTVNLPAYPASQPFNVDVHCASPRALAYYLTGPTATMSNDIFTNVATILPAKGIGIQLSNGSGPISTNTNVLIGTVGPSPTTINLTASYSRTTGTVIAGSVKSVIGMTFVYI